MKARHAWLAVAWCLVAGIVYASLTPKPPEAIHLLGDKLSHFGSYADTAAWFAQAYTSASARRTCALGLVALGIALEVLQGLGGTRMFDWFDALANTLGVVVGLAVTAQPHGHAWSSLVRHLART